MFALGPAIGAPPVHTQLSAPFCASSTSFQFPLASPRSWKRTDVRTTSQTLTVKPTFEPNFVPSVERIVGGR